MDEQHGRGESPQYSPDGRWWWDGQKWVAVQRAPGAPAATAAAMTASGMAAPAKGSLIVADPSGIATPKCSADAAARVTAAMARRTPAAVDNLVERMRRVCEATPARVVRRDAILQYAI